MTVPYSRTIFITFTELHPYLGGFIKFSILASMGDLLGVRIIKGEWSVPKGFLIRAVVWGGLGMMITLVFTVFMTGTAGAQQSGKLPFKDSKLALAFMGSFIMNITFGPMMYIYHKFADLWIDLWYEKKEGVIKEITLLEMVNRMDWYQIVSFSWIKTCLLIWTPIHTVVFLLPSQYRVLVSAFLSILLGILIALTKKKKIKL